jgi:hypothetical protein
LDTNKLLKICRPKLCATSTTLVIPGIRKSFENCQPD